MCKRLARSGCWADGRTAVGGTLIHWMTQSWRPALELQARSRSRRKAATRTRSNHLIFHPLAVRLQLELEPYYDEIWGRRLGQHGKPQRLYRPARQRLPECSAQPAVPLNPPRLPRTGFTDIMSRAQRCRWHPYPGPAGIRSETYHESRVQLLPASVGGPAAGMNAEGLDERRRPPLAMKTKNLKIYDLAHALSIEVDHQGCASGVLFLKDKRGATSSRPEGRGAVGIHARKNVCMLLLSTSKASPIGVDNQGQVGKHYIAQALGSAGGKRRFPANV